MSFHSRRFAEATHNGVTEIEVKEAFVKLFKAKAEEIYLSNTSLFNAIGLDDPEKLKTITVNHIVFDSFINIQ